jgi:hypothetical protein
LVGFGHVRDKVDGKGAFGKSSRTGVESASLDGDTITGVWKAELNWRPRPKKSGEAAEDCANTETAKEILRFTKRYGPLDARPVERKAFRFSIGQWRAYREKIRFLWVIVRSGADSGSLGQFGKDGIFQPGFTVEGPSTWSISAQEGDHFAYERGQLVYRTATLLGFLTLDLLSVPREYLRICKRPDCPTRYFVADHLRQDYCSPVCKEWAQRLWKRNWWNEKGRNRRKGRN